MTTFILLAHDFFALFFIFLVRCLSCVNPVYLDCTLALFNEIRLLFKETMILAYHIMANGSPTHQEFWLATS